MALARLGTSAAAGGLQAAAQLLRQGAVLAGVGFEYGALAIDATVDGFHQARLYVAHRLARTWPAAPNYSEERLALDHALEERNMRILVIVLLLAVLVEYLMTAKPSLWR